MRDSATTTDVVPFRTRGGGAAARHPRTLMERVYAAGSLALPADDVATKLVAVTLQALGLVVVEEVLADGTLRALARGEARRAVRERPWRVSKPPFAGKAGVPDAVGGRPPRAS